MTIVKERTEIMERKKRISVSNKRQMTIPKEFYDHLNLGHEVTCEMIDDAIIIKPIKDAKDFSQEILSDLIQEGYEGNSLLSEFKYRSSQLNTAVNRLIDDTRDYKTYSDINAFFGDLEKETDE